MVIVPIGNSLGAIESIMSHENPTISKITFDNWCFLQKEKLDKKKETIIMTKSLLKLESTGIYRL